MARRSILPGEDLRVHRQDRSRIPPTQVNSWNMDEQPDDVLDCLDDQSVAAAFKEMKHYLTIGWQIHRTSSMRLCLNGQVRTSYDSRHRKLDTGKKIDSS